MFHINLIKHLIIYFLFCITTLSVTATASENPSNTNKSLSEDSAESLVAIANQLNLSSSSQWLRLLHYNRGGTLHSRNKSYVSSQTFFISDEGKINPKIELNANIRSFFSKDISKRCIFPARFHWLSEQLQTGNYLEGLSHCTDLLKVQQQVAAKQITLIFPSAYLNSASSIFGHTLLRIDSNEDDNAVILNWAINYGAKLNSHDGAIKYALKGVAGLYQGQYFIVPYSQKIKEYGQMENRDIWEYPLSLSHKEVTFLTEHLWELKDVDFDYFFFDENCSYRLLELLEVSKPELNLTSNLRLTEIPINTVKTLHENKLIKEVIFRPSKERILIQNFKNLNPEQKTLSKLISQNLNHTKHEQFLSLTPTEKIQVLQTSYEYLRFQQSQEIRNTESAKRSLELLKHINKISLGIKKNNTQNDYNDPKGTFNSDIENDGNILASHDSHRLNANIGKIIDGETFQNIQYRMAYHDLLDNSEGFFMGAHIEGPSFTLKNSQDKNHSSSYIDALSLLDVMSLNPLTETGQSLSWEVGIEAKRSSENNKHLHTIIKGGGGFAWNINKDFLSYQLLSPRLELSPKFDNNLKAGIQLKLGLLRNSGRHPGLIELNTIKLDGEELKYLANISQQFELQRNHALRLDFNYFDQKTTIKSKSIALGYLYYF